jgi:3-phosphoshikimate 1-carboxyvinyltransferase
MPLAAVLGGLWTFVGQGRLLDRPLDVYDGVFAQSGALLSREDGCIKVCGPLKPGRYEIAGDVSSQFISGMLFALPLLDGDSEIVLTTPLESSDYVGLTIDVMRAFGVEVKGKGKGKGEGQGIGFWDFAQNDVLTIEDRDDVLTVEDRDDVREKEDDGLTVGAGLRVSGGQVYTPVDYAVEADWSQAAFFLAAGALGRDVTVRGMSLDSLQGDTKILDVLEDAGVEIFETEDKNESSKYDIFASEYVLSAISASSTGDGISAISLDVADIPDLVPPIAAFLCYAQGTSYLNNAGRLRIKESDRLAALAEELGGIGADIRVVGDSLVIVGKEKLLGGTADAHGDHRIAMAVAVAAIGCENPVQLTGWESVSKSYPGFWDDFEMSS